jgi:hypothetical protein
MRTGVRNMLRMAPDMMATMEYKDSPSKRSCMLSMSELHMKGAPRRMIPTKVRA